MTANNKPRARPIVMGGVLHGWCVHGRGLMANGMTLQLAFESWKRKVGVVDGAANTFLVYGQAAVELTYDACGIQVREVDLFAPRDYFYAQIGVDLGSPEGDRAAYWDTRRTGLSQGSGATRFDPWRAPDVEGQPFNHSPL